MEIFAEDKLTIFSVYHSLESKKLLKQNLDFILASNQKTKPFIVIANNSMKHISGADFSGYSKEDFLEIEGFDMPQQYRLQDRTSYHHGYALEKLQYYLRTRFALFLDPDFYLVYPEWIYEIIKHMKEKELTFFGPPWHPINAWKLRYFPSHRALFVDFLRNQLGVLDFTPQYLTPTVTERIGDIVFNSTLFRTILGMRGKIGRSRDTGYKIYRDYRNNKKIRFECAYPVVKSKPRPLEKFLPDFLCMVPKKRGYMTNIGFRDLGYFDAEGQGWEEFVWKNRPFGFHLRSVERVKENFDLQFSLVNTALESFIP